jgi:hypothetical protein
VVLIEGRPQDDPLVSQQLGVFIPELMQQFSAAFDICKKEGDGPGR